VARDLFALDRCRCSPFFFISLHTYGTSERPGVNGRGHFGRVELPFEFAALLLHVAPAKEADMFWFFIPLAVVVAIVVMAVWIIVANVNRADRMRARSPGTAPTGGDEPK